MAKHTAGPWEPFYYLGNRLTVRAGEIDLVEINYPSNKKEIGEANALLIAAAPELLEACVMARRVMLQSKEYTAEDEYTVNTVEQLTKAISRAEGAA